VPKQGLSETQKVVIVATVVLVAVIVGAIVALAYVQSGSTASTTTTTAPIVITGVNAQVNYANPSANYFGAQSQSLGGSGLPLNLQYGQSFYYSFTLRMGGYSETHSIDAVSLSTPGFTLLSVNPTIPYTMSSGSSVTLTITGQAPNTSYYGAVTITVSTH